jgi:hypothetical protein
MEYQMKTAPYNTNLASEFWVLSVLYRLGIDAHLTLGNKKAIDIVVVKDSDILFTIDVKGVANRYDWPADNIKEIDNDKHLYVFICFDGKISDPYTTPSVWIIPAKQLSDFIVPYKTRTVVSRSLIKKNGDIFKNSWYLITDKALP